MRTSSKLLVAVAAAGLVAAGSTAFTAANTGVDNAFVGYDDATISGVSVTNIEYVVDAGDASKLSSIVFTETQDVSTGYEAILTVNGPTTTQITCTPTYDSVNSVGTITCPTTGQAIATVTSVALTVSAV